MPRLNKEQLLRVVETAIRESGWNFLHLPAIGIQPAHYQIYRDRRHHQVLVYIWNLTHGGRNRPEDEWRIQATGVSRFQQQQGSRTLVLGWQDDWGVFAGFDVARHLNRLGHSPSIQLRQAALEQAAANRFAVHNKGSGELAVAFRPDYLVSYIESLESLHECGRFDGEVAMLSRIARAPEDVDDVEVKAEIAEPRRYAIISAKRALRDAGFRMRVLTAYSHSCAMCGVQLRLLDGAHILPAAHPDSTDGTDNGIALCALHHLAFDRALVTFDSKFRILVNPKAVRSLKATRRARGLDAFERALRPMLVLPPDRRDRPALRFVEMANKLRGW